MIELYEYKKTEELYLRYILLKEERVQQRENKSCILEVGKLFKEGRKIAPM
jgi:hypothetical protein